MILDGAWTRTSEATTTRSGCASRVAYGGGRHRQCRRRCTCVGALCSALGSRFPAWLRTMVCCAHQCTFMPPIPGPHRKVGWAAEPRTHTAEADQAAGKEKRHARAARCPLGRGAGDDGSRPSPAAARIPGMISSARRPWAMSVPMAEFHEFCQA